MESLGGCYPASAWVNHLHGYCTYTWFWNQCHQTSVSTCLFWCLMIFIYIIYVCDIWYVCICLSISIYVHLSSYLHRVWHTSMVSSNNLYPTLQHPEVWPSASTSTTTRVVWWIKSKRFWGQKSTFGRGCSKPQFDDFLGKPCKFSGDIWIAAYIVMCSRSWPNMFELYCSYEMILLGKCTFG